MIRDEAVATNALSLMENANGLLTESLKIVKAQCPPKEAKEFQTAMAHVSGRLFFLVMEPIYRLHPSLARPNTPKEFLDSWGQ